MPIYNETTYIVHLERLLTGPKTNVCSTLTMRVKTYNESMASEIVLSQLKGWTVKKVVVDKS